MIKLTKTDGRKLYAQPWEIKQIGELVGTGRVNATVYIGKNTYDVRETAEWIREQVEKSDPDIKDLAYIAAHLAPREANSVRAAVETARLIMREVARGD